MIITPSNTGSLIAGAGVGLFGWSLVEKGNKIPFVKRVYTQARKEGLFAWMNGNKGMALLTLEAINFGIHGITSADGVLFALGNTFVNIIGLVVYLPVRQRRVKRAQCHAILRSMKAA